MSLLHFFSKYTSIQMLLLTVVVLFSTGLPLSMIQQNVVDTSGYSLLDQRQTWNLLDAQELFEKIGERGRDLYSQALRFYGVIFLFSYFLFGSFLLSFIFESSSFRRYLLFVPSLLVISDLTEDYCILSLLNLFEQGKFNPSNQKDTLATIGSFATQFKWISAYLNAFIILIGLIRFFFVSTKTKKVSNKIKEKKEQ